MGSAVDVSKGVAVAVGAGVWLAGAGEEISAFAAGVDRQAARLEIRRNASNRRAIMRTSDKTGS